MAERVTIDARCNHRACGEPNVYRMVGCCMNCGQEALILYTAGHEATTVDCPVCQVYYSVLAQRLATPDEVPA